MKHKIRIGELVSFDENYLSSPDEILTDVLVWGDDRFVEWMESNFSDRFNNKPASYKLDSSKVGVILDSHSKILKHENRATVYYKFLYSDGKIYWIFEKFIKPLKPFSL